MQYGFHFDATRCTGCRTCVLACKDYHDLSRDVSYRQVYEYGGGSWEQDDDGAWRTTTFVYYVSIACNHCSKPACVAVCPTGAMHKETNGLVLVDQARCVGCGYCELTCPYRAPKVNRILGRSTKCDGCSSRLDEGHKPLCVEACPLRAIEFDDIDCLRDVYGDCAGVPPLPDASVTVPNVVITPPCCDIQEDADGMRGSVLNRIDIV